jgi:hypothetical protein
MEVDLSLDELADILAEELKLPRIEPKGKHRITTVREKYSGAAAGGARIAAAFQALVQGSAQALIASGDYDPDNPIIIPQKKDIRYRSWKEVKSPQIQRGHHLHDGRQRLDGRRAERNWSAWKASGSTPGCEKITRESRADTSFTMSAPRKSTSTPSTTCAKTAAPKSAAPIRTAKALSMPTTAPMNGTFTCSISATATTAAKPTAATASRF